jgi:hypothetical protein
VLLPSGRQLNLLAPDPGAWTDQDRAIGLSRTFRWAGYSAREHPLSVAKHSLTVLALRRQDAGRPLTATEARHELLHDAALLGRHDPITPIKPIKPHLGDGYRELVTNHQAGVDARYALPAWDDHSYCHHKFADRLAAASEGLHVVGWSRGELRDDLEITTEPSDHDPLAPLQGCAPWEPWPAGFAGERSLEALQLLTVAPGETVRVHPETA